MEGSKREVRQVSVDAAVRYLLVMGLLYHFLLQTEGPGIQYCKEHIFLFLFCFYLFIIFLSYFKGDVFISYVTVLRGCMNQM